MNNKKSEAKFEALILSEVDFIDTIDKSKSKTKSVTEIEDNKELSDTDIDVLK